MLLSIVYFIMLILMNHPAVFFLSAVKKAQNDNNIINTK